MKTKKIAIYIFTLMALLTGSSCEDNFLDRSPLDAISDNTFFTKSSDLRSYMNGMYNMVLRKHDLQRRWMNIANGTDDYVTFDPDNSLNTRDISGQAPQTSGVWNGSYDNIRKANYFIENAYKVSPLNASAKHYIGEGYFCRAFVYFELLQTFGGVPYIDATLNTDSEDLYKPRDSRDFIAQKIIDDLDSAIVNLNWKGEGEAGASRINKEAALVLKTRVGLYEGTWEKFHGEKNTKFKVEGKDGSNFLKDVVDAGEMLIEHQGANIFIGTGGREYNEMWDIKDYSSISGAFFYKTYSRANSIVHQWYDCGVAGMEAGITKGLVDQYLMKDGKPESISSVDLDDTKMNSLAENKDPRLGQTMWYPAKGTFKENFLNVSNQHAYNTSRPGVVTNQQRFPTPTGYRIWKGVIMDPFEEGNGETDDLLIRYAEGLLNYAEAKSLLGTITQTDIDETVNVIRSRVGMAIMNLGEVNGWNVTYAAQDGYYVGAPNIVNEIRRERRVELCLEGFRADDIKRWALLDDVYLNKKPEGAHLQELMDYWNSPDSLEAEGFVWKDPSQVTLTIGVDVEPFDDGFINPFWRFADFKNTGSGYYVDPDRDYLNAIPSKEIELYDNKGGVVLEQNPGWFN